QQPSPRLSKERSGALRSRHRRLAAGSAGLTGNCLPTTSQAHIMTATVIRGFDGRFASKALAKPPCTLPRAKAIYRAYLAAVCKHQGLKPRVVARHLAREGKPNCDREWRRAVYARQLALYLANTSHSVPQTLLAQAARMTPAGVCLALKAIEDLRDI